MPIRIVARKLCEAESLRDSTHVQQRSGRVPRKQRFLVYLETPSSRSRTGTHCKKKKPEEQPETGLDRGLRPSRGGVETRIELATDCTKMRPSPHSGRQFDT